MQANTNSTTPAAATPAVAKPASKPAAKRQPRKAAKPAKPAADERRNAERERCKANAAIVAPHYNGPSLATHRSVAPKLAEALARVREPIQRAKSATVRDDSALVLCLSHADDKRSFDPTLATSDLGTLSRLASLGFLTVAGQRVQLTETGFSRAKLLSKPKAAKA